MNPTGQSKLVQLLAAKKLQHLAALQKIIQAPEDDLVQAQIGVVDNLVVMEPTQFTDLIPVVPKAQIILNARQQEFVTLAMQGNPCSLTGAAGCGKTTSLTAMTEAVIQNNQVGKLQTNHKYLSNNSPSIVFISFTNKAVQNIKKVLPKDLRDNCITAHKLLEFEPEYFTTEDLKSSMRFVPTRHKTRPLPQIDILVIDEAPMMPVGLWNLIVDAIENFAPPQVILVGDIQQLPPVFGKSIFIHAIQQGLKVVELTEVYRQALGSPIIALATEVVKGKQIPNGRFAEFSISNDKGTVIINPWKKKLSDLAAVKLMGMWLPEQIDKGSYNPLEDMIITPYNEAFGTIALNQIVATHLAKKMQAPVYEIFSGPKKKYFRVGERVLFQKSDAVIEKIERNKSYFGTLPRPASVTMDYAGIESSKEINFSLSDSQIEEVDFMLEAMANHMGEDEKGSRQASHQITVYIPDLDQRVEIAGTGEVNALDLGYAITVYKSQGSEYRNVFLLTHHSQAGQIFRESVYTGITRAKSKLFIVCEPNFFVVGLNRQRIPGNTVAEKIANFDRAMQIEKKGTSEMPEKMWIFKLTEESRKKQRQAGSVIGEGE